MSRLALVTGAGSGIGQAVAIDLSRNGYDVALVDLDTGNLTSTREKIVQVSPNCQIHIYEVDVTSTTSVENIVNSLHEQGQTVTHVAACAGIFKPDGLTNQQPEDAARVMAVNYNGVVNVMRVASEDLIKNKGAAVLIGSTESHRVAAHMASYVASKHALLGYGKSIAAEMAPLGVRVNIVCPGNTKSGMYDPAKMTREMRATADEMEAKIPLRRIAEPIEIARVVRFLLSDDASYVVGSLIPVDGGRTL